MLQITLKFNGLNLTFFHRSGIRLQFNLQVTGFRSPTGLQSRYYQDCSHLKAQLGNLYFQAINVAIGDLRAALDVGQRHQLFVIWASSLGYL